MFTLKLYRRRNGLVTKLQSYHHVESIQFVGNTLEIRAFHDHEPSRYDQFYVGERTAEMTAVNDDNHWDWGLLENSNGRTTEHFRPHNYG